MKKFFEGKKKISKVCVLNFKEFYVLMDENCLFQDTDQEVKELFQIFDVNFDGFITEKEVVSMLISFGEKVKKKHVKKMISAKSLGIL